MCYFLKRLCWDGDIITTPDYRMLLSGELNISCLLKFGVPPSLQWIEDDEPLRKCTELTWSMGTRNFLIEELALSFYCKSLLHRLL